jgi:hydroxyacylglutathione hydrolase
VVRNKNICAVTGFLLFGVLVVMYVSPIRATADDTWFRSSLVAENIWCIDDNGTDNIYLVAGKKKAMLIDTGIGRSDLAKYVKTLTKLPLFVVNTHGHPDHSGGNNSFKTIYAHPADHDAIRRLNAFGTRSLLEALKDGDLFDLGGRTIEVIETPGHTPGSVCFIDKEHRIAFTGDTSNMIVWLFLRESLPLEKYLASLKKLNSRAKEFDIIMPGHGGQIDTPFLEELIACTENILNGGCAGETYNTFAGSGKLCSYKRAGVAFDPDNVREKKK